VPEITLNIVQGLTLAAIINAWVFSLLLLMKQENRLANRFLALLIFSLGYSLLTQLWIDLGVYNYYPSLHWLPGNLNYWFGPAFYLYVKSLTDPEFRLRSRHAWHLGWLLLEYPHNVYHLILGRADPYPLLHNFTEAITAYALFPLLVFSYLSYQLLQQHKSVLEQQYSTTELLTLNWLRQLFKLGGIILIPLIVIYVVDFRIFYDFEMEFFEGRLLQYEGFNTLLFAIIIYWLGVGGVRQSQVSLDKDLWDDKKEGIHKDYSTAATALQQSMENDQLFLDPELSIGKLAAHTGLSSREISAALNQHFEKNFYTFVNEFRVEEIKQKLRDPNSQHLTILSIALDAGFNSKATFNRIFRSYTGTSPRTFRDET